MHLHFIPFDIIDMMQKIEHTSLRKTWTYLPWPIILVNTVATDERHGIDLILLEYADIIHNNFHYQHDFCAHDSQNNWPQHALNSTGIASTKFLKYCLPD